MNEMNLEAREKQRMLEFIEQAFGSTDENWTDREILLNYNSALAMFIVAASKNAKE